MMFKSTISILAIVFVLLLQTSTNTVSGEQVVIEEEPNGIKVKVQVFLLGFNGDGAFNYKLDGNELFNLLKDTYPLHRPHSVEKSNYLKTFDPNNDSSNNNNNNNNNQQQDSNALMNHYDIKYFVKSLGSQSLESYEHLLRSNLERLPFNPDLEQEDETYDNETHLIAIEKLESFFEYEIKMNTQESGLVYTIFFVNPSKDRVFQSEPQLKIKERVVPNKYHYSLNKQICGPAWIGSSRYLVVDLEAGPLKYGSTIHKSTDERISEGSVDYDSLPRLVEYFLESGYQGTSLQGSSPIEIEAHMSNVVISAVRHVFFQDTQYDYIPLFPKILIPILIFKDHTDPVQADIELDIIRKEANRIFPFSQVEIVIGEHALHEHKTISMALYKSIRSHSTYELNPFLNTFQPNTKTYVDSKELLLKLKNEDDILALGIIGDRVTQLPISLNQNNNHNHNNKKNTNLQKTKILPVYIFSLLTTPMNLLLDKYYLYSSNQDSIVILQTKFTFQGTFYQGNKLVSVNAMKTINRQIVAGLANSQGIMGPTLRYSEPHQRLVNNYLWSYGQHPFGFFGNTSEISQIFIDSIIRNTIITSVQSSNQNLNLALQKITDFSTKYLIDSLGYDVDDVPYGGNLIDRLYHTPPSKTPIIKGVVKRLHDNWEEILKQMEITLKEMPFISDNQRQLQSSQKEEISKNLLILSTKTLGFLEYVKQELDTVESQLLCCAIAYALPSSNTYSKIIYFCLVSFGLGVVGLCVTGLSYLSNGGSKGKKRSIHN
ncbi:hypothetical protein CYY_000859 [Polysphondylium violaceum]|uniref:DUF7906 domain-containing protein n=1 Tax=Polysphondylium violaceum TaxID=133409 RepID=A0A8J4Q437_9MYCE|nr:hypothetical protein CYY_000859 [Polysphondylium violaceum]